MYYVPSVAPIASGHLSTDHDELIDIAQVHRKSQKQVYTNNVIQGASRGSLPPAANPLGANLDMEGTPMPTNSDFIIVNEGVIHRC